MILYFSATGNSKYCAEKIAGKTDDLLVSLNECMKYGKFSIDCNGQKSLGFVSPIYGWDIPWGLKEYLKNVELQNVPADCYLYGLFTCGATSGYGAESLSAILRQKGLRLCASFAVTMPDTYIPMHPLVSEETQRKQLAKGEELLTQAMEDIYAHREAQRMAVKPPKPMYKLIHKYVMPGQRKVQNFWVTEDCIGCGQCAEICPQNIIELKNNHPVWTEDQCLCCLGCLHRCPKAAIQYGKKTQKSGRYTNPNTTL